MFNQLSYAWLEKYKKFKKCENKGNNFFCIALKKAFVYLMG